MDMDSGGCWSRNPAHLKEANAELAKVRRDIKASEGKPVDLAKNASDFRKSLEKVKFSPIDKQPELEMSRTISVHLLGDLVADPPVATVGSTQEVAASIRLFLAKLDEAIEEDYKPQLVSANVMPPAGTRNATSGMSPDAIADPMLKKQYLDAIKAERVKNLKNVKQRDLKQARESVLEFIPLIYEKALKADQLESLILEQFTPQGKSRELLEKMIKSNK